MKTYIAQRRIDHDNRVFEDGAQIDLDDSIAMPLLAIGAVMESQLETSGDPDKKPEDKKTTKAK